MIERFIGKKANVLSPLEMGGINATLPLMIGAQSGIPVVDADGMGRAFPEAKMVLWFIYGVACTPLALCDEKGNKVLIEQVKDIKWLETFLRTNVVAMGALAGCVVGAISKENILTKGVPYSISQSWRIGQAIANARFHKRDPIKAICEGLGGKDIFRGKLTDVQRKTAAGFASGSLEVTSLEGDTVQIDFQNENLIVRDKKSNKILVTVPDLIVILDPDTGRPILTEELRYGFRVAVVALPCHPLWRRREALDLVGPRNFGYDATYKPVADYVQPKPLMLFKDGKIVANL